MNRIEGTALLAGVYAFVVSANYLLTFVHSEVAQPLFVGLKQFEKLLEDDYLLTGLRALGVAGVVPLFYAVIRLFKR